MPPSVGQSENLCLGSGPATSEADCGQPFNNATSGCLQHLPKFFEHHGSAGVRPFGAKAESHIHAGCAANGEEGQGYFENLAHESAGKFAGDLSRISPARVKNAVLFRWQVCRRD